MLYNTTYRFALVSPYFGGILKTFGPQSKVPREATAVPGIGTSSFMLISPFGSSANFVRNGDVVSILCMNNDGVTTHLDNEGGKVLWKPFRDAAATYPWTIMQCHDDLPFMELKMPTLFKSRENGKAIGASVSSSRESVLALMGDEPSVKPVSFLLESTEPEVNNTFINVPNACSKV